MAEPWRMDGSVELLVDALAQQVYDVVADVTSTGERSDECVRVEWLKGVGRAEVGARFRGRNRHGLARWSRICEVVEARPGASFAFRTVPERWDPSRRDSTLWRYDLLPRDDGKTLVRHSYQLARLPLQPFRAVYGALLSHHKDMRPAMTHTLLCVAETVERRRSP